MYDALEAELHTQPYVYCAVRTWRRDESPFHKPNLPCFSWSSRPGSHTHSKIESITGMTRCLPFTNVEGKVSTSSFVPSTKCSFTATRYGKNMLFASRIALPFCNQSQDAEGGKCMYSSFE